jgi:hypothetical protein
MRIAPEEARTEEVLKDEHQLLLGRLNLELSERIRCVSIFHFDQANSVNSFRLDAQKKRMIAEKEKLLSENKKAEGGLDALVVELDGLSKVRIGACYTVLPIESPLDCRGATSKDGSARTTIVVHFHYVYKTFVIVCSKELFIVTNNDT